MKQTIMPAIFALLLCTAVAIIGCDNAETPEKLVDTPDEQYVSEDIPEGNPARGAEAYATTCAGCHGENGTGGRAPSHVDCDICNGYEQLYAKINDDMPDDHPDQCVGRCAADTAAYIYVELNGNSLE